MDNQYMAGDIVFVHGSGFFDKFIQFGQRLRFNKNDSFYNHVALIIDSQGTLIESTSKGVKQSHISKYENPRYQLKVVNIPASTEDRVEVLNFAKSCLSDGYSWIGLIFSALCVLSGLKFSVGFDEQFICSGLVAASLERTNAIFPRNSRSMTPADLLAYFGKEVK